MTWFKPRDLLDRTFEISIIAKGLDGLLELAAAMIPGPPPVMIAKPARPNAVAERRASPQSGVVGGQAG